MTDLIPRFRVLLCNLKQLQSTVITYLTHPPTYPLSVTRQSWTITIGAVAEHEAPEMRLIVYQVTTVRFGTEWANDIAKG